MKLAVVAITWHGIALAGKVVTALPGASLFAPEKFRAEAEAVAPAAAHCYSGKVGEQVPAVHPQDRGVGEAGMPVGALEVDGVIGGDCCQRVMRRESSNQPRGVLLP